MTEKLPSADEATRRDGSGLSEGLGALVTERAEDRVLLGLAGTAADCGVRWEVDYGCYSVPSEHGPRRWNPLADDGDALRLAVQLDLTVIVNRVDEKTTIEAGYSEAMDGRRWFTEHHEGAGMYAATRRAIVRAAAALGANKTPNAKLSGVPR